MNSQILKSIPAEQKDAFLGEQLTVPFEYLALRRDLLEIAANDRALLEDALSLSNILFR